MTESSTTDLPENIDSFQENTHMETLQNSSTKESLNEKISIVNTNTDLNQSDAVCDAITEHLQKSAEQHYTNSNAVFGDSVSSNDIQQTAEKDFEKIETNLCSVNDVVMPGDKFTAANRHGEIKNVVVISVNSERSKVYVHYSDTDKRLDEWIPIEFLLEKVTDQPFSRNVIEKKFTRSSKRKLMQTNNTLAYLAELDSNQAKFEKARDEATKIKNIQQVHFGKYLFDSWYFSPYPEQYGNGSVDLLHVCRNCFKYFLHESSLSSHSNECKYSAKPPGKLIYTKDNYRIYEVSGEKEKLFCQCLCLFAKLFLDHKMLYYNVHHFNFYLLYQQNNECLEFIGYFSKELNTLYDYNLSCILTLPCFQRQGWGRFLIQFSYALSRLEGKLGTPEKPLSDLGTLSYRKFWCTELVHLISVYPDICSVRELSRISGFCEDDVHQTLHSLNLLKYWKDEYVLEYEPKYLQELCARYSIDLSREKVVDIFLIYNIKDSSISSMDKLKSKNEIFIELPMSKKSSSSKRIEKDLVNQSSQSIVATS